MQNFYEIRVRSREEFHDTIYTLRTLRFRVSGSLHETYSRWWNYIQVFLYDNLIQANGSKKSIWPLVTVEEVLKIRDENFQEIFVHNKVF